MQKILSRVYEILWRRDIEYAEIQGALVSMLWGTWFFVTKDQTLILVQVASHSYWGIAFMIVGALQLCGLLMRWYWARRIGAMSATVTWLFVGILCGLNNWRSFNCPMAIAFATGSIWGFLRIRRLVEERSVAQKEMIKEQPALAIDKKDNSAMNLRTLTAANRA